MIHPTYPELGISVHSAESTDAVQDSLEVTLSDGNIATVLPTIQHTPDLAVCVTTLGIKASGKEDFTVIALPQGSTWAGLFTRNRCPSFTVTRNLALRTHGSARLIAVNSGNANVFTPTGDRDLAETARLLSTEFSVAEEEILIFSTGVIGQPLPIDKFRKGVPGISKKMKARDLTGASRAILTTDVGPKVASVKVGSATICGIAKGAGMIEPNLATMLVYIFTDARFSKERLHSALQHAATRSFNAMSIDSDTSTNDSVIVAATGELPADAISFEDFQAALTALCIKLTRDIASQGEGVTKLIEVSVASDWPEAEARHVAKSIINSPLIKCAVHGADPNWGRIVMAIGKSAMNRDQIVDHRSLHIKLQGESVYRGGDALAVDWTALSGRIRTERIVEIAVSLGERQTSTVRAWGCDLSSEYVAINADYTT